MKWYIAVENKAKEIPEEVLIYKFKNNEISLDTLVVNAEIKKWTPLKDTKFYKDHLANNTETDSDAYFLSNPNTKNEIENIYKSNRNTGSLVIYSYTGWFLFKPSLKIYLNGEYIGNLSYKARSKEIPITKISTVEIKCHIRSTEVRVFPETHTEIYTEFDRFTGSIVAEVRSYQ